jgi:nucleoid DNA-binding protein
VVLQDFGSFEVEKKMEYISVNPVTKQRFLVPPELAVSFKSATSLKGRVKNVLSDE